MNDYFKDFIFFFVKKKMTLYYLLFKCLNKFANKSNTHRKKKSIFFLYKYFIIILINIHMFKKK